MKPEEQLNEEIKKLKADYEAAETLGAKLLSDNIEFLLENVALKELLNTAVIDIKGLLKCSHSVKACGYCAKLAICNERSDCNTDVCKWRYADKALNIIEEHGLEDSF